MPILQILSNLAESYFTTGRFAECEKLIIELLANPDLGEAAHIAMNVIGITNFIASGKRDMVKNQIEKLITSVSNLPRDFKVGWNFTGTKHFIEQHEALSLWNIWLQKFFHAIESEDRDTILTSLKRVQTDLLGFLNQ